MPFLHNDFKPVFDTSLAGAGAGLMLFDVTYTDPAQIPSVLAPTITYISTVHPLPSPN